MLSQLLDIAVVEAGKSGINKSKVSWYVDIIAIDLSIDQWKVCLTNEKVRSTDQKSDKNLVQQIES